MTEEEKTAEVQRLLKEEGHLLVERVGQDEWVGLYRLMFHYTVRRGTLENIWGYDDHWCYTDKLWEVLLHWAEWKSREFAGEPGGWQRHPRTARRRTDGDPAKEYYAS